MEYCFANCVLSDARHDLVRGEQPVQVEPQVFDLLLLLARNAGELVTRDRMIAEIWSGRFVSDSAITACVAAARRAVADDGKAQAVIRTIARRGLTMAASVTIRAEETGNIAPAARPEIQRIRYARNVDGRAIAYALTGSGPNLLRVGMPLTMDLEFEWRLSSRRAYLDRLNKRFRLLRFDNIGSGQSDRSFVEYDFARQAEDAVAVADAAGFERFAVYSTSGGVLSAVHLACRYPDRVSRLAIIGGYADGRGHRGLPGNGETLRTILAEGWSQVDGPFARAFLTAYFPEGPADAVHDMVRMMQAACPPDVMLRDRDAINDATVTHLLSEIKCPTIILHGRYDGVHPLSEAQKLAARIPNAELVVFETANHFPLPGNATFEPFMDTLVEFLSNSP